MHLLRNIGAMQKLTLPLVEGSTKVKDAFKPMVRSGVSGLIVNTNSGMRLLHFNQVLKAFETNTDTLSDVVEYVAIGTKQLEAEPGSEPSVSEFEFRSFNVPTVLADRLGEFALAYFTWSPGYCCTGPDEHCYPPNERGSTDNCVVPLCPGKLP